MEKYLYNFRIAFDAMKANKVRSLLTSLGIIFGVASVIAMLAIGEGTQKEILEQMKLVGVNNIVISPLLKQDKDEGGDNKSAKEKAKFSKGLTIEDARAITEVVPTAVLVGMEVTYEAPLVGPGKTKRANLVGVNPDFFKLQNLRLKEGSLFGEEHALQTRPVCVIGAGVKTSFFSNEEPVGRYLKCGKNWFRVIGVLESMNITESSMQNLGISNFNNQVYAPLETVLVRHKNKALVTQKKINEKNNSEMIPGDGQDKNEQPNYNQLDKITVQINDTRYLKNSAEVITRLLKRRHSDVQDFEIRIPEMLLKQQADTKNRFKFLLACIAGISLLVGGIGIMNIMLATVMERIREIGIRLSVGATKKDIIIQFMTESVFLSAAGGIIGILLGIAFAFIIPVIFDQTPTVLSLYSIIISFLVSAAVGIIFGLMPAKRAAELDPILSLRHD